MAVINKSCLVVNIYLSIYIYIYIHHVFMCFLESYNGINLTKYCVINDANLDHCEMLKLFTTKKSQFCNGFFRYKSIANP